MGAVVAPLGGPVDDHRLGDRGQLRLNLDLHQIAEARDRDEIGVGGGGGGVVGVDDGLAQEPGPLSCLLVTLKVVRSWRSSSAFDRHTATAVLGAAAQVFDTTTAEPGTLHGAGPYR